MIRIRSLVLDGFRGYANRETVDFGNGSVFVLAPNGRGKSSLSDAFEFLMSDNGTLERLGVRDKLTSSGRQPLRNSNRAASDPVSVTLAWGQDGGLLCEATREVTLSGGAIPPALRPLLALRNVPFLIRGHDLRAAVEQDSPMDRYKEVAGLLGASDLVQVQDDIRSLKTRLTQSDDTEDRRARANAAVQQALGEPLDLRRVPVIMQWLHDRLHVLGIADPSALTMSDAAIQALADRAAEERSSVRLGDLQRAATALLDLTADDDDGPRISRPLRIVHATAQAQSSLAEATVDGRRQGVLRAAIEVLEREDVTTCPVCDTPFLQAPMGSRTSVLGNLRALQDRLSELEAAVTALKVAREAARTYRETVAGKLRDVGVTMGRVDLEMLAEDWKTVYDGAERGDGALLPAFVATLRGVLEDVNARVAVVTGAGATVFQPLLEKVRTIVQQREAWTKIDADAADLRSLREEIDGVGAMVNAGVRDFLEGNVAALGSATADIYNRIQRGAPVGVSVSLRLTTADAADARILEMVLDFPGMTDVKPQGYLSDSQINTLALAFRVAIIRRFNPQLPFLILDDVFTSHDAEFRDQAAEMLVQEFADMQMLVLTHDEMFAKLVQDKASNFGAQSRWKFLRIATFDVLKGPRFLTHVTPESSLTKRWDAGESAGSLLRTWVEEWLTQISRSLGARYTMRPPTRPYEYAHGEMALAIRETLKKDYRSQTVMADVPEFLAMLGELTGAVIENSAAHNQGSPYASYDPAAERQFHARVKRLQRYFVCGQPGCGAKIVFSESQNSAICSKKSCSHVFSLRPETW